MPITNPRWSKEPNNFLVEYINSFKPGTVLDLGGSDGTNALFLAKNGFEVTNVDKDTEALKDLTIFASESNLNIKTVEADLNEYVVNAPFDNIISFFTFHFLLKENGDRLINNIQENTKEGGLNILIGFTDQGEFNVNPSKCYFVKDYLIEKYKSWEVLFHTKMYGPTKSGLNQEREILVVKKI